VASVVVIEDSEELTAAVAARLRSDGHSVELAADGPSAVELVLKSTPDLVILDLMLPGFDGLEVCRRVRRERLVPIIMLTALGSETDRVVGLELGADDYLTKPFSMRELTARVGALLRRSQAPLLSDDVVVVGDICLDSPRRRVTVAGQPAELTTTEFDLFAYLLRHPGVVRSRETLLAEVWGYRDRSGHRTVDSHIRAIRQKVGASAIRTVHGVGYAGADTVAR